MCTVRITIASLLAACALVAGGAVAQHSASAGVSHKITLAGPVPCCFAEVTLTAG